MYCKNKHGYVAPGKEKVNRWVDNFRELLNEEEEVESEEELLAPIRMNTSINHNVDPPESHEIISI